jgi:hypothetical protein
MDDARKQTLLAILAASLLVAIYAAVTLVRGHVYDLDRVTLFASSAQFFHDAIAAGELPLWCGGMWGGFPIHGEGQSGFFSPLRLAWFLGSDGLGSLAAELAVSLVLAAVSGAWAGRLLGQTAVGAATCGVVWALGGAMLAYQDNPAMISSHLAAPLGVAFALRGSWRGVALCLGFSLLGGHPYGYALCVVAAAIAWLIWTFSAAPPERVGRFLRGVGALLLALLLGAVQLIPTVEVVLESARFDGLAGNARALNLLELGDLRHIAIPWADVRVNNSPNRGLLAYIGVPALVLAAAAAWIGRRDRTTRTLVGIAIGTLSLALVASAANELVAGIPLLSGLRGPAKALFAVSICVAFLVGKGSTLLERKHRGLAWALLIVITLDVGSYGQRKVTIVDGAALRAKPKIAQLIPDGARVRAITQQSVWGIEFPDDPIEQREFLETAWQLEANTGLNFGLEHLAGYSPLPSRRSLRYVLEFHVGRIQRGATTHVVLPPSIPAPAPLRLLARAQRWSLYTVPDSLPWARVCERAVAVRDWKQAVATLDKYPASVAVLEGPAGRAAVSALDSSRPADPGDLPGTVEVRKRTPSTIVLDVELTRPALVVVADSYFPGWHATLGDSAQPILLADGAWKAVAVPAGSHVLRLSYRPTSFTWGAWLSALATLGLLASWVIPWWRAWNASRKASS